MSDIDDREIVCEIGGGNLRRFDVFVDRYKHRLVRFLTLRIGDPHRAEDLSQEVFLRVFRNARGYSGEAAVSTWLFTIAANCATDHLRARGRRPLELGGSSPGDDVADQSAPQPIDGLILEEAWDGIASLLSELSEELRETLALRIYGELTFTEIGHLLGCPVSTAKTRVRLAIDTLRRRATLKGVSRDD